MKLYLFSQYGNFGEFIEIVSATTAMEAWDISKAKVHNWDNSLIELIPTSVPSTIYEGGGDTR